jgi:hypothetical protein
MENSRVAGVALGVVIGVLICAGAIYLAAQWSARTIATASLIDPPIIFVPK